MQPEVHNQPQNTGQWKFAPEGSQSASSTAEPDSQTESAEITWTASEFIAYQKNFGWYALMLIAVIGMAGVAFLLLDDYISSISILFIGILFIIFASRKPRVLNYRLDSSGISIGDKMHPFSQFKSFSIIDEGSLRSISLLPLQRFMPAISMYFEPQDESKIIEALANYLPHEDRKQDPIDKLMHKIRF